MQTAKLTKVGDQLIIRCPYNASLVEEIRSIPGRRWNPDMKAWAVPAGSEQQVRELVRQFFQIEGEESQVEYEIVRVKVTGKSSSKRSYLGGVTVDGKEVFSTMRGYLDMRPNDTFQILDSKGGFTYGDGYINNNHAHAFEVEYELVLKVRKGAQWAATGHADYWGTYEFLEISEEEKECYASSQTKHERS